MPLLVAADPAIDRADGMPLLVAAGLAIDGADGNDYATSEACPGACNDVEMELNCFVTFLSPSDGACLGLGLHVHRQNAFQRRCKLLPEMDLLNDYLDIDAFNEGVRHGLGRSRWNTDASELPSMVSSTRRPLNGWVPLYINAHHWARSRRYAATAFSYLARGRPVPEFRAKDALNVCCNLLTCAAVGFTKGQCVDAAEVQASPSSARAVGRGKASEKAVQMYADVHRLLLQLAQEHSDLRELARQRLMKFIQDPAYRTRARTPSLGDLVQCLLVVDDVAWEDLAPSLIPEALRRHAARQSWWCEFRAEKLRGEPVERLIAAWDEFAPLSGMVLCFCSLFLHLVGRPNGRSLNEVRAFYDARVGRLREEDIADVVDTCTQLCRNKSSLDFLPLLLPRINAKPLGELFLWAESYGRRRTADLLGELVLWAEKFSQRENTIPAAAWPQLDMLDGPFELLQKWRESAPPTSRRRSAKWSQLEGRRKAACRQFGCQSHRSCPPGWSHRPTGSDETEVSYQDSDAEYWASDIGYGETSYYRHGAWVAPMEGEYQWWAHGFDHQYHYLLHPTALSVH
jgi:hypothetical protein